MSIHYPYKKFEGKASSIHFIYVLMYCASYNLNRQSGSIRSLESSDNAELCVDYLYRPLCYCCDTMDGTDNPLLLLISVNCDTYIAQLH